MKRLATLALVGALAAPVCAGEHDPRTAPVWPEDPRRPVPIVVPPAGCETRPNIFGSQTIDCGSDRPKVVCRPNVFDGVTCDD